jgi:DNA-binding CsgD family transcriptional regulator/tetratricopeptide (TPR) repeat protein
MLGDPGALEEQQRAVELVPPEPSVERARVVAYLAQLLMIADRFEQARGPAEEAVAVAGLVGAPAEETLARTTLGNALVMLGEADAALTELQAARRLATAAGEPGSIRFITRPAVGIVTYVAYSHVLLATGRLDEAATVALEGILQARHHGLSRSYGPLLICNATEALFALGRWDQADRISREALEIAPLETTAAHQLAARAALEIGRGDLDTAEQRLQAVRRLLPAPLPEAQKAGPLFTGLAEIALWRGNLKQARDLVAEAVPLVEANSRYAAPLYALGVRVEADRAELARARSLNGPAAEDGTASALLERLDRAAAGPAGPGIPELSAWHATGLAEQTRRDDRPDPSAWATAVAAWDRLGQPYRVAYGCFRQAEALLAAAGDRPTAAEVLRRAAGITARLGARPLHSEIAALARRVRLDVTTHTEATAATADPASAIGAPTPGEDLRLTPREAEVLALVAAGRSNREIARALFISPKTVSVHVSNILAKLGAHTRVEAAAIAHRLGLD